MTIEWRNWCRLCAGSNDVSVSLHEEKDVSKDVIEKVNKYLKLDISIENENSDYFPQQVCNGCVRYLQQIDSFAVQCSRVQDMFYNLSLESGGDKIYVIRHRFLNSNSKEVNNVIEETEKHDHQVNCSFEVKSYETVPSTDYVIDENQLCSEVDKINGLVGIPRRGRPRKRDRVVPRLKLRAVRHSARTKENLNENKAYEVENGLSEDLAKKDACQKSLVGAARRKTKLPKNVQSNPDINECVNKTIQPEESGSIKYENEVDKEQTSDDSSPKRLKKSELKTIIPSLFHFQCHICGCVCKNWNALRNHCKDTHEKAAQITCDCGKVLFTRAAILEHLARHTRTNLYSCEKCKKTFHRKSLLNIHVVSHLPKEEQPFVCCKCARRFHCEALLRNHERTHLPIEERFMFPCNICNKMFTSKSSVSAHQKAVHHGERPFVCEQCGHSFTSKGILQEHLTVHSDEVPWSCSKCDKSFKTKYRLKMHMDTHRETPYQCPKCPVQLSTRRTLRMHLVVHRDTKAYQCSTCNKAFRRAKDLKNHTNLHTGRRPYACPFCARTFANGSNCRSHKLRMHRAELLAHESSNLSTESIQVNPTVESYKNDNVITRLDIKKEDIAVANVSSENVDFLTEEGIRQSDYQISHSSVPDSVFTSTFLTAADTRYPSQSKQTTSPLRTNLSQHLSVDHQYYSPCHEQDVSSSTIPAFPGIPFIHHQSVGFNRNVNQS